MLRLRIIVPLFISIVMMSGFLFIAINGTASSQVIASGPGYYWPEQIEQEVTGLYQAAYSDNRQAVYLYAVSLQKQLERAADHNSSHSDLWAALLDEAGILQQALEAGRPSSAWLDSVVRLKLAADSLSREEQALWLNYEHVLKDDLDRMSKAWGRQTTERSSAAIAQLQALEQHAVRIELAAYAGSKEAAAKELISRISYAKKLLQANDQGASNAAQVESAIRSLDYAVDAVFSGIGQKGLPAVAVPVAAPHPVLWSLLLGAIIAGILTFTGWKKYKRTPYGVKPLP